MAKNMGPIFPTGAVICNTASEGMDTFCYSTEEVHGFLSAYTKKTPSIQQTKQEQQEHQRSSKSEQ
jgi:hypothetical protein